MAIWDYFDDKHVCIKCGDSFIVPKEIKYGHITHNHHYKAGDKIHSEGQTFHGVLIKDSLLKYLHLGSGIAACQKEGCGGDALGSDFMVIQNHVITGGLKPCSPAAPAVSALLGAADWVDVFSHLEMLLLVEQHGCDKTYGHLNKLAAQRFGENWGKRFSDLKNQIPVLAEARMQKHGGKMDAGFNADPEYLQLSARIAKEFAPEKWREISLGLLNDLWERRPTANFSANHLAVGAKCPSCSVTQEMKVPFEYGPNTGRQLAIGEVLSWKSPGTITTVRDPRVKYVRVELPQCASCSYVGAGYVTVICDKINDIFLFPKDILDELLSWRRQSPPPNEFEPAELVVFVGIREFGEDNVRASMQSLSGKFRFVHLADSLNKLSSTKK